MPPYGGGPETVSIVPDTFDKLMTAATVRGDTFVFSTTSNGSIPAVAAGNYLNVVINNIGNRRAVMFERRFDNNVAYNSSSVLYGGIASPAPLSPPIVNYGGSNLNDSYGASTELVFTSGVYNARLDNSTKNAVPASMGYLPVGDVLKLMQPRMIGPGKSFGQFVAGQASGLAGSGTININFTAYVFLLPAGF